MILSSEIHTFVNERRRMVANLPEGDTRPCSWGASTALNPNRYDDPHFLREKLCPRPSCGPAPSHILIDLQLACLQGESTACMHEDGHCSFINLDISPEGKYYSLVVGHATDYQGLSPVWGR